MLRLSTTRLPALDVHAYQNELLEWLIEQDITPNDLSYLANGSTGDGPVVPEGGLSLLLRRAVDVMRLDLAFGCRGVTPQTLYDAVRAEASVPKFVLASLARTVYAAVRQLIIETGIAFPDWDHRDDDEQQFFLQLVREYLEDLSRSAEQMHAAWMDRRLAEGWRYAPEADLDNKLHPSMVPFGKLAVREQHATRLIVSAIASLAPLLHGRPS